MILTGVGSLLISAYYNRRSRAKDKLWRIEELVEQLESLGSEYWMDEENSLQLKPLELSIKLKTGHLSLEISRLKISEAQKRKCDVGFIEFKKAIQSGNFEVRARQAEPRRTDSIQETANSLKETVRLSLKIY